MKRFYLFLMLLATVVMHGYAEDFFELTANGFRTKEGSDYAVVAMEGSASELYNKMLLSVGRTFNSPKDVISTVPNRQISINAIYSNIVKVKGGLGMADAHFVLIFEFKDGRMRVLAPKVMCFNNKYGVEILYICKKTNPLTQVKNQSIFDHVSKELRSPMYKYAVEYAFNKLIYNLIYSETNGESGDDW